jgi:hypothetical protein
VDGRTVSDAADAFAGKGSASAGDLDCQRGVGKVDPGGDLDQFHGPGLDSAAGLVGGGVSCRDLFPGHGPELVVQAGLVAFDDQDVVRPDRTDTRSGYD